MASNLLIFSAVILAIVLVFSQGQQTTDSGESDSKIKGPLVTLHESSFADTLLVLLQSLYYNDKTMVLDSHRATTTIDGVDLIVEYDEGTLSLADASLQTYNITLEGTIIRIIMSVPVLMVNKTYTIRTAHDPDYTSKGYVTLTDDGMQLQLRFDSAEIPYFSNSVELITEGIRNTTIHGQGIPLADEIQDAIQKLLKGRYISEDIGAIYTDILNKLDYIFEKNELILCLSCETPYCTCYD